MFYSSGRKTDALVIYGLGAPVVPDSGNLPDAPIILNFDTDLLVPDYIGYGRSGGRFTPKNCIRTFLLLYEQLTNGCIAHNYYENIQIKLKYKRIIFIGRSFGGTYLPLLPRFNNKIGELGIIYPAVDNKSCGSIEGEESNEDFMRSMREDGYHYLYRGILNPIWSKHLINEDGLSPMDNIPYLSDARLFIGHGKEDRVIHFSKSVNYFEKIKGFFPDRLAQFKLNLYPETGHTFETSNPACQDLLKWLNVKKLTSNS